jgi:hypothetical protein
VVELLLDCELVFGRLGGVLRRGWRSAGLLHGCQGRPFPTRLNTSSRPVKRLPPLPCQALAKLAGVKCARSGYKRVRSERNRRWTSIRVSTACV